MTTHTAHSLPTWTWADQVSSWRFWGLVIFYILTFSSINAALDLAIPHFIETGNHKAATFSTLLAVRQIAMGAGLGLAWLAIKWRPRSALVILAALGISGLILLLGLPDSRPAWVNFAGWGLVGLSTGAITLTIPAVIAAGSGGAEAFLVSFGLISILGISGKTIAALVMGLCLKTWGNDILFQLSTLPAIVGALIVMSVDGRLFTIAPPERGYSLTPRARKPLLVSLFILFVPFYFIYWIYRAHGEVAAVAPSRALLSPRGALFCTLFVPFLPLVAMAGLIEALNRKRREHNQPPLRSPMAVYLWTLLFPPAGGFLIQSGLNRFLSEQPPQTAP